MITFCLHWQSTKGNLFMYLFPFHYYRLEWFSLVRAIYMARRRWVEQNNGFCDEIIPVSFTMEVICSVCGCSKFAFITL